MLEISYRKILAIAVPLMFGTFVQSVVMLTDTAFVSELGTIPFNAVNNAGLIYISLFMFSKGLADGSQIIIARKYGEQDYTSIGQYIFNTQLLQIILGGILFTGFFFLSDIFIHSFVKSSETGECMVEFLKYRSWGIFFAGMHASLTAFYIGIGRTKLVLISTIILAFSNIFLDYAMIFGHFGFPELGMKGAPLASSISELLAFAFLSITVLRTNENKIFQIKFWNKPSKIISTALLKLGTPLMFQGFLALFGWLIFFMMIEQYMSPHDLEVSAVIRSIYFVAFIPLFGFGATTRTYVSNLIGRKSPELIPVVQRKMILLCFISVVLFCHGALLYPAAFIPVINDNPDILADSADVMRIVTGSILLFSVVTVWFNSVAAVGKSNLSFMIEMISIGIYLIACYVFIVMLDFSVRGIWLVEYVYFGSIGILSYVYLRSFRKKNYQL
ncbi:MAG: MATE family efflux transporter [Crocinitomicaceae bacterium]|nr:MATE family efflux transporter [Crocinitomicaceae bacterium]